MGLDVLLEALGSEPMHGHLLPLSKLAKEEDLKRHFQNPHMMSLEISTGRPVLASTYSTLPFSCLVGRERGSEGAFSIISFKNGC